MSDITVQCPACKIDLLVPSELAGTQAECPNCAELITIPMRPFATAEVKKRPVIIDPPKKNNWLKMAIAIPLLLALLGFIGYMIYAQTFKLTKEDKQATAWKNAEAKAMNDFRKEQRERDAKLEEDMKKIRAEHGL